MAEQQNYTLGRGQVFFSRFKGDTQVPLGFRYIGNTPEFSMTIETENLDHFSSDRGIREKDDSVPLEVTRNGTLVTDNIHPENVALFFFGVNSKLTQIPANNLTEAFTGIVKGTALKLGVSSAAPSGLFGISKNAFNVYTTGASLVAATGTVTFAGAGADGDIIEIGGIAYTMRAVPTNPNDVDIGGTATDSAANLVAAVMAGAGAGTAYGTGTLKHPDVTASNAAGVVTVTASVSGTAGNDISLSETGSSTSVSGANLSGGSGASFIEGDDYEVDYDNGLVTILAAGAIPAGGDVSVAYSVRGSTRERVISGSTPVEGAIKYVARNPKGQQINYYLPWVKITPNGDYALKGDEWQQIPMNIEILKPAGSEAIYADGQPIYS